MNDWSEFKSHKLFFDNLAKQHQFDPLNADNWYSIQKKHVAAAVSLIKMSFFNYVIINLCREGSHYLHTMETL